MAENTPLWKSIVAGAIAGACEIMIMYPTDVVKTRQQLSPEKVNMITTFRNIISSQGVHGLYRGIVSPIMAEAPKRAWKFTANAKFKEVLINNHPEKKLTNGGAIAAGTLAGITETFINCPFETVKVRMQSKEFLSKYKSSMECLIGLIRTEGVISIYKGFEPQAMRNGLWNGTYFGFIGIVNNRKIQFVKPVGDAPTKSEKLLNKFLTGTIGSSLGTCCNTPFDVVKSRMQMQTISAAGEWKYRNALHALTVVSKEEGTAALWKGIGPRLLRLGPGGGIMILVFDLVSSYL